MVLLLVLPACSDDRDRGGADHVLAGGAAEDRDEATFVMASGADVVRVRAADLGGDLYRVATPDDAKVVPKVHLDQDTITTTVADAPGSGPAVVTAELSARVRWRIRLEGGAKEEVVDLTEGKATAVEIVAGTSLAEVRLPPPEGRVQVSLAGGASDLKVHLAGSYPAQVRVGGGAGTVTVDDDHRTGVAAGTVLTSGDWTGSGDRYEIELSAGVSRLSVSRTATG
ncbi:hypothetical protein [Paractinoplanes hotanensis]|uniref:Adhesin domain-containing protein n=1 Tax=Paractinoplanes hotanensis TaxID=2906497 RepID=A0ABT0YCN9_9ACTN|nr:hypothetical protein [Actinoplanes hotanensis]MCM4083830.1 hypothetical protein [Actinoplanes hotanensis]